MRKIGIFLIIGALLLSLAACDNTKSTYDKACALYDSEQYQKAMDLFLTIPDYEGSPDYILQCERIIGMEENADNEFLAAIQDSVHNRLDMNDKNEPLADVIRVELGRLEKYYDMDFYNEDLKECAKKYIEGLHLQQEALDLTFVEQTLVHKTGLVMRYEALMYLYEEYGAFEDDQRFLDAYVSNYEDTTQGLESLKVAVEDVESQGLAENNWTWAYDYTDILYFSYTNNTSYTLDYLQIYVRFYDTNGQRIEETIDYIDNIAPGESCQFTFYPTTNNAVDFEWFFDISI